MIPLFAVTLPANAETIFTVLLQVASFDMIPVEKIYDDMLRKLDAASTSTFDYL